MNPSSLYFSDIQYLSAELELSLTHIKRQMRQCQRCLSVCHTRASCWKLLEWLKWGQKRFNIF